LKSEEISVKTSKSDERDFDNEKYVLTYR
jgi:hypothetical protein